MTDQDQAAATGDAIGTQSNDKQISVHKIYTKDISFESPNSPNVFKSESWSPKTNLNLRSTQQLVEENLHEVTLTITIDAKHEEKTAFLIELQQAGLFLIQGYNKEEMGLVLASYCPNIIFPYARETVAALVMKGGFPEFILQPINFDALYAQTVQKQAQEQGAAPN